MSRRPRARWSAALLGAGLVLTGCGTGTPTEAATTAPPPPSAAAPAEPVPSSPTTSSTSAAPTPSTRSGPARPELPRGGRRVFPEHRLVGYAGRTGSPALGRLGIGDVDTRVRELERRAQPYAADGRTVLPVLEVIATTVQASPGRDGKYRTRMGDKEVERYLEAARKRDALLLLAVQPGRADLSDEVEAYDRWLAEPDVGVALDPEWAMGPGEVPGRVFGSTTGAELDAVARHLSALTTKHDLPEKVMVFHELAPRIVTGEGRLRKHRGVVAVKSIDGIGSRAAKENTYRVVGRDTPTGVRTGFKLFYEEDREGGRRLMTPAQVMALEPRPAYVMYE